MARTRAHVKTVLDPRFPIPAGAETEFEHAESDGTVENDAIYDESLDELIEVPDEAIADFVLNTPEQITVVGQKLRRAPGGQNVVDVVIEVADIPGAVTYEIRRA